MPSAISKKTPKTTSKTTSPTERTGKLKGKPMSAAEFDRIAREHGARPLTAAERKAFAQFLK